MVTLAARTTNFLKEPIIYPRNMKIVSYEKLSQFLSDISKNIRIILGYKMVTRTAIFLMEPLIHPRNIKMSYKGAFGTWNFCHKLLQYRICSLVPNWGRNGTPERVWMPARSTHCRGGGNVREGEGRRTERRRDGLAATKVKLLSQKGSYFQFAVPPHLSYNTQLKD